ncbi:MAG: hypothetical protein MK212_12565 [Saprospiraceae bacterium]|nr:hypothetical protein [Saprospiraceae bacterium]
MDYHSFMEHTSEQLKPLTDRQLARVNERRNDQVQQRLTFLIGAAIVGIPFIIVNTALSIVLFLVGLTIWFGAMKNNKFSVLSYDGGRDTNYQLDFNKKFIPLFLSNQFPEYTWNKYKTAYRNKLIELLHNRDILDWELVNFDILQAFKDTSSENPIHFYLFTANITNHYKQLRGSVYIKKYTQMLNGITILCNKTLDTFKEHPTLRPFAFRKELPEFPSSYDFGYFNCYTDKPLHAFEVLNNSLLNAIASLKHTEQNQLFIMITQGYLVVILNTLIIPTLIPADQYRLNKEQYDTLQIYFQLGKELQKL